MSKETRAYLTSLLLSALLAYAIASDTGHYKLGLVAGVAFHSLEASLAVLARRDDSR